MLLFYTADLHIEGVMRAASTSFQGDWKHALSRLETTILSKKEQSGEETGWLLRETHHAYHTEMNDILLTAVGIGLKGWDGRTQTLITLEGHGRDGFSGLEWEDERYKHLDVSRTVGWFTTLYPFVLELREDKIGEQIKGMKERLRQIPNHGFDYGILRYVVGKKLKHARPWLSFNYLGQLDEVAEGLFGFVDAPSGVAVGAQVERQHLLDMVGVVAGGRLALSLMFNPAQTSHEQAETLLAQIREALLEIVVHCQGRTDSEMTVSDFTADVSEDDLDSIMGLFGS